MGLYIAANCKSALNMDCDQRIILRPKTVQRSLNPHGPQIKAKLHGSIVENAVGEGVMVVVPEEAGGISAVETTRGNGQKVEVRTRTEYPEHRQEPDTHHDKQSQ